MKGKCLFNTGKDLPKEYLILDGYSIETQFHYIVGEIYNIFGIVITKGKILYLVDYDFPYWVPSEIFEIIDPNIPKNWIFKKFPSNSDDLAIFSYREMVMEVNHNEDMLNRLPNALAIFRNYAKNYDSF